MLATAASPGCAGSAPSPPIPRRVLFGILRRLEQDGRTGLVRICADDGQVAGHVMLASGRLCFAASTEGHIRIGEVIAAQDAGAQADLDDAVRDARNRGMRLCEVLLERESATLARIRGCLRLQTARAFLSIAERCPEGRAAFDLTPARDDYDHRLTFTALDVFVTGCSALDTAPPDDASELFAEFVEYADAAVLLVRGSDTGGLPFPVAARGLEESSLQDIVVISRSAAEMSWPGTLRRAGIQPHVSSFQSTEGLWVCATGEHRITLIRTKPQCEAGQVVGYALRLRRRRQ